MSDLENSLNNPPNADELIEQLPNGEEISLQEAIQMLNTTTQRDGQSVDRVIRVVRDPKNPEVIVGMLMVESVTI
jgi:hypothetical protein